jgi:hypothetical protein
MVAPLRHRQTKEAETDMFDLQPPRHISTLHFSSNLLLNARALVCPEELAKADMRQFRRDSAFDPQETLDVHCGNGFDAGFNRWPSLHPCAPSNTILCVHYSLPD